MSEYRPGGFQILPPVVKSLIIANVVVYIIANFTGSATHDFLYSNLSLYHWSSPLFKPWQFITHMFMHEEFRNSGGLMHIGFNMLALWMFGNVVENLLGPKKFLLFYFICGIGAAFFYLLVFSWENAANLDWYHHLSAIQQQVAFSQVQTTGAGDPRIFPLFGPMIGASGAIFGVLFAFGYLLPDMMVYLMGVLPMKAKYSVALYAGAELFFGIQNGANDHVAHFAHIGGMVFAFLLLKAWKFKGRRTLY